MPSRKWSYAVIIFSSVSVLRKSSKARGIAQCFAGIDSRYDTVVHDFAALLKSYRMSRVTGDRYAGEFPRELFRKHGIAYDLAKQTKSELFLRSPPALEQWPHRPAAQ